MNGACRCRWPRAHANDIDIHNDNKHIVLSSQTAITFPIMSVWSDHLDYDSDANDSHLEELREYYYDLVIRAPEVEDVLHLLKDCLQMLAWKEHCKKSKTFRLTASQIDSLLDPNVVDWHDFLSRYLDTICKRRATGKKSSLDRSHDQIDDLEALAYNLQHAHPEFIANACKWTKVQWQSCIDVLAFEFQRRVNTHINQGEYPTLTTRVRDILRKPWTPDGEFHEQTIYYVAGAVVRIIMNLIDTSKEMYHDALKDILAHSLTTKEDAKNASLPSAKVERKEVKCLCYANLPFYSFIVKLESVFDTLLSEGNMALYGEEIVADITHILNKEELGFDKFFLHEYDSDIKTELLRRIIWSYGRLRGKDFVRKCIAKEGAKYHETTRSELGTTSGLASRLAKQKGIGPDKELTDKEEKDPQYYEYLIKRKKDELVTMCKKRKLRYSGTKKVLVGRIMDYEKDHVTVTNTDQDIFDEANIQDMGMIAYYDEYYNIC